MKCLAGCVLWLLGSQSAHAASLISVTPTNQSVYVPVTSTVQFEFDYPITQLDWMNWFAKDLWADPPSYTVTNLQVQWSADRRKLAVSVPEGFPALSKVEWNIGFGLANGLGKSVWGSFSTGPATNIVPSGSVDVHVWRYSDETFVDSYGPFQEHSWSIQIKAPRERLLKEVWMLPSGGEAEKFYGSGLFPTNFSWGSYGGLGSVPVAEEADLVLSGFESNQIVRIPEFEFSAPPRFLNVFPGDTIDPAKDLIVEIAADGLPTTSVELSVSDVNGGTSVYSPLHDQPDSLDGSSNRFLIAAGTLPVGDTLYFSLNAWKSLTNRVERGDVVLGRSWVSRLVVVTPGGDTNQAFTGEISTVARFEQVGSTDPVPSASSPFGANATILSKETRPIRSLEITTSSGKRLRPRRDPYSVFGFQLESNYSDAASFESDFGHGNYSLTIAEPDRTNAVPLALDVDPFPVAPKLVNFTESQSIQPAQDFVLNIDVGGDPSDFVRVVLGESFRTADFGSSNALSGASNTVVIPKSALAWWSTNELRIERWRIAKSELPGLNLNVGRVAETVVQVRTAPVTNSWPQSQLLGAARITGMRTETNALLLNVHLSRTNYTYRLLRSFDLINWTPLGAILATSTNHVLVDPSPTNRAAYYLIRSSYPWTTESGGVVIDTGSSSSSGSTVIIGGGGAPPQPPVVVGP